VLLPADWTAPECPQSAEANFHHPAQSVDREGPSLFFREPERSRGLHANRCRAAPYGFWFAKN